MKELLIFIYTFYEYYFYAFSGIIGSILACYLCKKRLTRTFDRGIAIFAIVVENGIIATIILHQLANQIVGFSHPYLSMFLLKILVMLINGIIISVVITYAIPILRELNSSSFPNWFGIATFLYLSYDFLANPPEAINEWGSVWYATDYSMGIGSRFFIGSLLKLFYDDYLYTWVAYYFCYICACVIIVIVSCIANVIYLSCKKEYRIAFSFIWLLFLVSPGSVAAYWHNRNFGRLETYCLLISLLCLLIYENIKSKPIAYCIITILSCISIAIYQGNVFMYYSLVLMIFIWEILTNEGDERNRKRTSIIWASINLVTTSITFIYFQFFSSTVFNNASEMKTALSAKTDIPISEMALDLELFQPISVAFDTMNKGFLLGDSFPRENALATLIFLCPIVIMFIGLYLKCFSRICERGWKALLLTPHLYYLLLVLTIIPQFILNIDWGRWMICANIILFSGFLFLLRKKDESSIQAITMLDKWISRHQTSVVIVIVFITGLERFGDVNFIHQVDSIVDYLVYGNWIGAR